MSGSRVVTEASRKNVPVVVLKRARSRQQEARHEGLPLAENNMLEEGGAEQDPLVKAERILFSKRVSDGLARVGRILKAFESDETLGAEEMAELAKLTTLKALEERLPVTVWKVFQSGFSQEEWDELVASETCISSESRAQLRTLWLKRQKQRLDESCETAIDLTIRDEDEVEEQFTLVNSCTAAIQKLLDRVGMNARGTVKRVPKVLSRDPVKAQGSKKRVEVEAADVEGNVRVVKQKPKPKAKPKANGKEKRKVSTASELSFDEEDADADADDDVVIALHPEKDKEEEEAEPEDEPEEEEDDDDAGDNLQQLKIVFDRMRKDVAVVEVMLQEAASGQVLLNVGPVCAPDLKLASEDACKALLADVEQLSRYLRTFPEADEVPPAERWGVLLKWWRLVEQAFSITGLFEHLRGMRRGKKSMAERYAGIVKRLKKEAEQEEVLSYKQARKYDQLGRFLLNFPRFMYQLQLVSLSDWQQKAGPQSESLMNAIEDILSMEEVVFWSEKVVVGVTQQEQPVPAPAMMEEVFDAFEGQSVEQLDLSQGFRNNGMEVEAPDEPDFEDDDSHPATPPVVEEECPKCGLKAQTVFLQCDGPDKKHHFCWKCSGYSGPPPLERPFPGGAENGENTIKTYVFCAEHLKLECCTRPYGLYKKKKTKGRKLLKIGDFVNHVQAEEVHQMVAIFTSPERKFSVVPTEPNGWCIFVAAAKGLDMDWEKLVNQMKVFAREYLKNGDNAALLDDPQEARRLWSLLDARRTKSVQEFWSSDAADLLIPMLSQHSNTVDARAVQFRVWMIGEKGGLEMTKFVYPEGETREFKKVVDLLKTNPIVEHYDLLTKNRD